MNRFKAFANRHPVLSYLLLSFGTTWPVWFCVALVAGTDWTLGKFVTGIGFVPSLVAIVLDRLRGSGAAIGSRRWVAAFLPVAFVDLCRDFSSLLTGDARNKHGCSDLRACSAASRSMLLDRETICEIPGHRRAL